MGGLWEVYGWFASQKAIPTAAPWGLPSILVVLYLITTSCCSPHAIQQRVAIVPWTSCIASAFFRRGNHRNRKWAHPEGVPDCRHRTMKTMRRCLGSGTILYCNRNVTGRVKRTRTGSPLCLPGVQLGMLRMMRMASASSWGSTDFTTCSSQMLPSLFTTN